MPPKKNTTTKPKKDVKKDVKAKKEVKQKKTPKKNDEEETEETDSELTDSEEDLSDMSEEVSEPEDAEISDNREISDDEMSENDDDEDEDKDKDDNDDNVRAIDDIETTTKIDEDIISKTTRIRKLIPHDQRTISDRMTRYELANLIANRAKHIQMGAEIFIDIDNMDKEEDIAKKEIMTLNKKTGKSNCELYISRFSHSDDQFDYYENWFINEMIIPKF